MGPDVGPKRIGSTVRTHSLDLVQDPIRLNQRLGLGFKLGRAKSHPSRKKKHSKAEAGFRPAGLIYFGSNVCLAKHTFIPNPLYFISNKSFFYIKKFQKNS
jgi:hypothetical protein